MKKYASSTVAVGLAAVMIVFGFAVLMVVNGYGAEVIVPVVTGTSLAAGELVRRFQTPPSKPPDSDREPRKDRE
ncbi:hypothetical protein [Amycolatopsis sp. DG1A-15b]|uniref:hypothetical protein n=1 Tax=Amycolatopsis sp. DG1A-15b TaxID=3052846 RepID=UPI00255B767B|nr:hypothetical protein [Amycolatopsis sp. DG1A-15b]WIX85716.1 hypothetical protein QRY02_31480 [Amycolatopsis sp. DG1A-15b]